MKQDKEVYVRVRSIKYIDELLKSTASCAWANGCIIGKRVSLARFSPDHIGDRPTNLYCTVKDYEKTLALR